jgi:putative ABC transport system permease protein
VSLALGIGANTAIFSLVNAVLLRPQPLLDPGSLTEIYLSQQGFSHGSVSYPDYADIRAEMGDVFEGVATARLALLPADAGDGAAQMVPAEFVSGNYFALQGIGAQLGRTLLPEDDVAGEEHPVVVLSHDFWRKRFGGAGDVVGRSLRIGGRALTVAGVIDGSYGGMIRGLQPDVWVPVAMVDALDPSNGGELEARGNQSYFARARVRPGVTDAEVTAAAGRMTAWLHRTYPDEWQGDEALVNVPTKDVVVNPMIDRVLVPALGLLMGVVGIVLLIACANLAGFLLARAADRRQEMAVRLALGAGRLSLIRQLITETTVLSLIGGGVGVGLAFWLIRLFENARLPLPVPIDLGLRIDGTVLLFTAGLSLVAGVLFGLAPALESTNRNLVATIRSGTAGGPRRRFALRNLLVVLQVASSLVLLVGAGLLLRSMQARQSVDPGFGRTPAAIVSMATNRGEDDANRLTLESIATRVAQLPGVGDVGLTTNLHLNTLSTSTRAVTVDGIAPPSGRDYWEVDYSAVSPDYFDAIGLRLLAGRVFDDGDHAGTQPVVIVNRAFVDRFFPDGDPIGRTINLSESEPMIVGVVNTAKIRSLGEAPRPYLYGAFDQGTPSYATLVASTAGRDPRVLALEIARLGRDVDPDLRIYETGTMAAHIATILLPARLSAGAASVFAVLALLLASVGLYGVVSYAVSRRTREVGIRISLGAVPGGVVRLLMGEGLRLVVMGAITGLALSIVFALLLSRFLFGVTAFDPGAFAGTAAVLLGVAVLASWLPARRATRVSPVQALKAE